MNALTFFDSQNFPTVEVAYVIAHVKGSAFNCFVHHILFKSKSTDGFESISIQTNCISATDNDKTVLHRLHFPFKHNEKN